MNTTLDSLIQAGESYIPILVAARELGLDQGLDQLLVLLEAKTGRAFTPACKINQGTISLSRLSPDGGKEMRYRLADDMWVNKYLQLRSHELVLEMSF